MLRFPTAFIGRIRRRIAPQRSDILGREQGQAILRVAVSITVLLYLTIHHYPIRLDMYAPPWLVFLTGFIVFSVIVVVMALRDQRSPFLRRVAANVMDVAAITDRKSVV